MHKMKLEWQTVQALTRLLLQEQAVLDLHCWLRPRVKILWCCIIINAELEELMYITIFISDKRRVRLYGKLFLGILL